MLSETLCDLVFEDKLHAVITSRYYTCVSPDILQALIEVRSPGLTCGTQPMGSGQRLLLLWYHHHHHRCVSRMIPASIQATLQHNILPAFRLNSYSLQPNVINIINAFILSSALFVCCICHVKYA